MKISEIKKGMKIKGDDGRLGIVTEVRDGECFFARPAERPYVSDQVVQGVGTVMLIMATPFYPEGGGRFKGYWADGKLDSEVVAEVIEEGSNA